MKRPFPADLKNFGFEQENHCLEHHSEVLLARAQRGLGSHDDAGPIQPRHFVGLHCRVHKIPRCYPHTYANRCGRDERRVQGVCRAES